ncbi:unnamed protein product [Amaranthus hypochondriacus]
MMRSFLLLVSILVLRQCSLASSSVVEHTFHVIDRTVELLCARRVITTVNGSLPGPLLRVREADTLIVHVYNKSPYDISIHW